MRILTSLLVLAPFSLLFAACGGDDSGIPNPGDSGSDTSATGDSSAKDGSGDSSTLPDSADTSVADASDAAVVDITCTDPSTCDGGSFYCCGTMITGAGSPPACPIKGVKTVCTSTCTSDLKLACSSTDTIRLCSKQTDCTELGYSNCCEFMQGGQTVTFCTPNAVTGFAVKCNF